MKNLFLLIFAILLISTPGMAENVTSEKAPLTNAAEKPVEKNKTQSVNVGAFVGTNPPTLAAIKKFQGLIGRNLNSIMWFQGWDSSDQPDFPAAALNKILADKATNESINLHLTWEPAVDLKDITKGVYDPYLEKYADSISAWGKDIQFRFAHEMIQDNIHDGKEFYRWQDQPEDYVKAFRHVHDIFEKAGANNAKFVWCPNNAPFEVDVLKQYYPGEDYVDWLCMDGYNWGNSDAKPGWPDWTWFDDIFANIYNTFVDNPEVFGDKPIMIGEFGSCEAGPNDLPEQHKAEWIKNAFERMTSEDFKQIKAFHWFQIDKECDWRVNSSTAAKEAFKAALENERMTPAR